MISKFLSSALTSLYVDKLICLLLQKFNHKTGKYINSESKWMKAAAKDYLTNFLPLSGRENCPPDFY